MTFIGGLILMFFAWKLVEQDKAIVKAKPCYVTHDYALTYVGAFFGLAGLIFTMVGLVLIFEGPIY